MSTRTDDWRACAEWLVRCHMLPADHKLTTSQATLIDLAQLLKDGVLICHLLNRLKPNCIDPKTFSQRPQMSQYLCKKNIKLFLETCHLQFCLKDADLFQAQDLFEMENFAKVIKTLSVLSNTPEARKFQYAPFAVSNITKRLTDYESLASSDGIDEEPVYGIYGEIGVNHDDEEEEVYGSLVHCTSMPQSKVKMAPKSKRDMCINELLETEKKYVDTLHKVKESFMKPLSGLLEQADHTKIFYCIPEFYEIHSDFYQGLVRAIDKNTDSIADCFVSSKEKFLDYGKFCSNLTSAQELVDSLCKEQVIEKKIQALQMEAYEGRFKLRDMLSVPMQRILKYPLLLKEMIKNTDDGHSEKKSMERALDEMQDLALYINEVKRDNESLKVIQDITKSINGLVMPENTQLSDYGRLLKDGIMKMKFEANTYQRHVFLFNKVMILCKPKHDTYDYKENMILSHYQLESHTLIRDRNFGFAFVMTKKGKEGVESYTMGTKAEDVCQKWIDAILLAQENNSPKDARTDKHDFQLFTFEEPTICDVCRKLLRGVFYQGYKCSKTKLRVHKECISKARNMDGPPALPPRPKIRKDSVIRATPTISTSRSDRPSIGRVRAVLGYEGHPSPSDGRHVIRFTPGDEFDLISDETDWWEGRIGAGEGFFPSNYVTYISPPEPHRVPRKISGLSDLVDGKSLAYPSNARVKRRQTDPNISTRPILRSQSISETESYSSNTRTADMNSYPWYVGGMSREEAATKLERLPNGSYLIRVSLNSSRIGEYALSIKYDVPKHIKLQKTSNDFYYLADKLVFETLPKLVEYYQVNSLGPNFPDVPTVLMIPYRSAEAQLRVSGVVVPETDVIGYCTALYDYSATEPNQISITTGDKIFIVNKAGGFRGWWKGRLNGKVGYFPSAYVTEVDDVKD